MIITVLAPETFEDVPDRELDQLINKPIVCEGQELGQILNVHRAIDGIWLDLEIYNSMRNIVGLDKDYEEISDEDLEKNDND